MPDKGCICGSVLKGLKTPLECKLFASSCTPDDPKGACMVSSEGTCAAYYRKLWTIKLHYPHGSGGRLMHDLIKNILDSMKALVTRIVVNDLRENTYYAAISVKTNGSIRDVDARPSDAIALALRVQAPIYVEETSDRIDVIMFAGGFDVSEMFASMEKEVNALKSQMVKKRLNKRGRVARNR
jgi:hypothetical protein